MYVQFVMAGDFPINLTMLVEQVPRVGDSISFDSSLTDGLPESVKRARVYDVVEILHTFMAGLSDTIPTQTIAVYISVPDWVPEDGS